MLSHFSIKMITTRNTFFLLALCFSLRSFSADTCQQCMDNSAYCINATHYYFCNGNSPLNSSVEQCDSGKFCTSSDDICAVETGTVQKACNDDCNTCVGKLACVSQTQFALCRNGQPTSMVSSCDAGYVCSVQLFENPAVNKICAPADVVKEFNHSISCDNVQVTTIAPSTSAPPTATNMQQQCEQAKQNGKTSRYFYTKNTEDDSCNSYIYCETSGSSWEAVLLRCKNGGYFDSNSTKCVQTKPQNC